MLNESNLPEGRTASLRSKASTAHLSTGPKSLEGKHGIGKGALILRFGKGQICQQNLKKGDKKGPKDQISKDSRLPLT